jgi:hypothetical protein
VESDGVYVVCWHAFHCVFGFHYYDERSWRFRKFVAGK